MRTASSIPARIVLTSFLVGLLAFPEIAPAKGKLKVGDTFPHFTAIDLEGNKIDTKNHNNKALLLDFWSIYCSSCLQEMPHIVALYNKYRDQGLAVIGIDLDVYGAKRVRKFIKGLDFTIPYPNVIDTKMKIKNLLGVSMLPTTIVVDPEGVVQLFHVGYKPGFEKELEEVIKKHLPNP